MKRKTSTPAPFVTDEDILHVEISVIERCGKCCGAHDMKLEQTSFPTFMVRAASVNMGSEPTRGGAENISLSSGCGCRLSIFRCDRFAPAEKVRFPPILWKNNVLLARNAPA